ncbi:MAG TPA: iron uptake transporter permease EfeU [Acidimicrobiales bacterium]|nr:iron uptake transporter permease EfeU [Acidimicrobiales bacterium]
MSWSDAFPNLLIGLREGLEAGLVVSILLAALHKSTPEGRRASTALVWLGALGAVSLAGSFAAVLTYSTSVLSSRGQAAVGGLLSVLAVCLVTGMVFWMRRAAAGLSAQLRGEVEHALTLGAGALAVTAFLAVGREGLETTLFLWTAVRASGQTVAPLAGAGLGLAAAAALCWLLYHRAVRLDLGEFFGWTALALIVIAAGVLSYGLGELQEASLLPGLHWVAFDLTGHVDTGSWWVSLVSGATELAAKMTVLQVASWAAYLGVVVPAFLRAGRGQAAPAAEGPGTGGAVRPGRWERLAGQHPWQTAAVLVAAPVAAAGVAIAALPAAAAASTTALTVTSSKCAPEWTSGHTGTQAFTVGNKSGRAGEVNLVDTSGAVVAEIETIGPATSATMTATLGPGTYSIRCAMSGRPVLVSAPVPVSGPANAATAAVAPVSVADLGGPNNSYQAWASQRLGALSGQVAAIVADLRSVDLGAAKSDWLTAQMSWEEVGASYDSFGDLGLAVDGLPDGLPAGVDDPHFTGLHRLEYGLWHGQPPSALLPVAERLEHDVGVLRLHLSSDDVAGDPTNLPLRAHEILEDALRDHLSGIDDEGAGAAYAETYADLRVTRVVLGDLGPLLDARGPMLVPAASAKWAPWRPHCWPPRARGQWQPAAATPVAQREAVDAAAGALLETLSAVPNLLEVPPGT